MKVILDKNLDLTHEYFNSTKNETQKSLIWMIILIVLGAFTWAYFAEFEEVVKTSGLIRPIENISSVSNAVTGRIQKIEYRKGETVKKGQLLLSIDPTQLEAQKDIIVVELERTQTQIDYLNAIQESIKLDKNVIPLEYEQAYLRYELWKNTLEKLNEIQEARKRALNDEQKLPMSMTTTARLKNLESEYAVAKNEYEEEMLAFKHDIATELENYTSSYNINLAKLQQIEDSLLYTQITAPIEGTIQEKRELNVNDWIQAGEPLFNIVPIEETKNKVELYIPAKQAGKIRVGMNVKMRFPSLPFHEFGDCEGKILTIDPDVTHNENGEAYFLVVADMNKDQLIDKNGTAFPLKVGLQTDARIILSKKPLLSFFLKILDLWY